MSSGGGDFFADVAGQDAARLSAELYEPEPPQKEHEALPEHASPIAAPPYQTLRTQGELKAALKTLRAQMQPFLKNHAPKPVPFRQRQPLDTFDWRLETDADTRDFIGRVLNGGGDWQAVEIPHYGGPTGKATAFYRTTVTVSEDELSVGASFLCFTGADYKAHAFVNGAYVGSHEGFFAPFEFDVSAWLRPGENTIVVRLDNDAINMGNAPWGNPEWDGDKIYAATGPGWDEPGVGWRHCPPGMGLYQAVYLEHRPEVFIHDLFVRPLLTDEKAEIWIEVYNATRRPRYLEIGCDIHGRNFEQSAIASVRVAPSIKHKPGWGDMPKPDDNKQLQLTCSSGVNYFKLSVDLPSPRVWNLIEPWLYQAQVTLYDPDDNPIDTSERHFGMRSFTSDEATVPKGRLFLNGEPIRLRGANTMGHLQQCVMKGDLDQLVDDILLAKICHLNFFRMTQRPVQAEIYDHFDMLGILSQSDFPAFGCMRRNQFDEGLRQVREMERLLRPHPSCVIVSYINEPFPNGASKPHRQLDFDELRTWFEMADKVVRQTNPDRVTKAVDGDYDPPSPGIPDRHCYNLWYGNQGIDFGKLHRGYWQVSKKGWMHGCGEFGAEALDSKALMTTAYPEAWLEVTDSEGHWVPDGIDYNQTYKFHHLWYETPRGGMESWVRKSNDHQRFALRHVGEAFRRDNLFTTCAVHLLVDAFPSSWLKSIISNDRVAKGGYFGLREAFAPLAVSIRTDRFSGYAGETLSLEAWIANDVNAHYTDHTLHYAVATEADELLASGGRAVAIAPCQASYQGDIRISLPNKLRSRRKFVVTLTLLDGAGRAVHQSEQVILGFPKPRAVGLKVFQFGDEQASGMTSLLDFLAVKRCAELPEADVIVTDGHSFSSIDKATLAAVENGARLLVFALPEGTHDIGGHTVTVSPIGMAARHVVSRDTGHPCVSMFEEDDLRFWHDAKRGYISPFYDTCIAPADYIDPILTSGAGGSGFGGPERWRRVVVAGDIAHGAGVIRLCQIDLGDRVATNGTAGVLAHALLASDRSASASQ